MQKNTVTIIILLLLPLGLLKAQEKLFINESKHKIGFDFGLGQNDGVDFLNVNIDRDYKVALFQFQYSYLLFGNKTVGLEAIAQPQFNFSRFRFTEEITEYTNGFEIGVNIGLLARVNLFKDRISFYGLISSGPHHISRAPERQARGFIFSDNFFIGLNIRTGKSMFLDIRPGKRHISNLSIKEPNGGINTFIINVGILKLL